MCRCIDSGESQYAACNFPSNETAVFNATVSGAEVVEGDLYALPWYWNIVVAVMYGILFRFVAYLALRFFHKRKQ